MGLVSGLYHSIPAVHRRLAIDELLVVRIVCVMISQQIQKARLCQFGRAYKF